MLLKNRIAKDHQRIKMLFDKIILVVVLVYLLYLLNVAVYNYRRLKSLKPTFLWVLNNR